MKRDIIKQIIELQTKLFKKGNCYKVSSEEEWMKLSIKELNHSLFILNTIYEGNK